MIGLEDKELLKYCLDTALEYGADKARVTLSRSIEDLVATLNAEVDRITHCGDSSLSLALFADGRYGTFSTNKLDRESIREFIAESIMYRHKRYEENGDDGAVFCLFCGCQTVGRGVG